MTEKTRFGKIGRLALYGVLAGAVLAASALPASALAGVVLKAASQSYEDLPADLRVPASAQRSYLYANDGKTLLTSFYDENRVDVPINEIATTMQQAIVAAEDTRFYEHGGVDLRGVVRAFVANSTTGEVEQGASTLTMQYVRNVLKSDPNLTAEQREAATAETKGRKIQEMRYAIALEKKLSKQEILDRYLNIAYFGAGAYGVGAASQRYFGKPASALTLGEASLLAGLVQSPDSDSPISGDKDAALSRRAYVLDAMAKMKVITEDEAKKTAAEPLVLHPTQAPNDCGAMTAGHVDWGFFCDYFRQWWNEQPAFGSTVEERQQALRRGGYTIVTSLDPKVQTAALNQSLTVYGYNNKRALPIAAVEPGTGRVLALAVNRHYSVDANPGGQQNYPNTVNQLVAGGGTITGYQAGSTFKMFTMLAALENGRSLDTAFDAPSKFPSAYSDDGPGNCNGAWCPSNENPAWMDGYRTMWTGFGRSVNTYFVWLEQQVGSEKAVEMAQRFGIKFRAQTDANLAKNSADRWGAFTLGVASTTPLDLANAYATLGAEGVYCKPLPVNSITGSDGKKVDGIGPSCNRVVSADVARAATDAARCPVGGQSSFGTCDGGTATQVVDILDGRQVAGKTGSSEENATETFVGFTPQLAVAGIAANPDDPGDFVGSAVAPKVNTAVARTLMAGVTGKPAAQFTPPSREIAYGGDGQLDVPSNQNNNQPNRNDDQPDTGNTAADGTTPGDQVQPGVPPRRNR
ncbi:membrane peptidoglycan carboxypeptidase [Micromonospora pisi]|uniref:Membrane peptidoglycan carboxypeptidase n=1 Tax=Micromonospora pisi TaxID=589240 RepID=A0A495JDP0_9ACTN|nr:transglycosylase domain-containing protein [Micromonospora pisi]RKR86953.1 membrane peptidoglycan carboxypeptidase [Micromonospora pisi]